MCLLHISSTHSYSSLGIKPNFFVGWIGKRARERERERVWVSTLLAVLMIAMYVFTPYVCTCLIPSHTISYSSLTRRYSNYFEWERERGIMESMSLSTLLTIMITMHVHSLPMCLLDISSHLLIFLSPTAIARRNEGNWMFNMCMYVWICVYVCMAWGQMRYI